MQQSLTQWKRRKLQESISGGGSDGSSGSSGGSGSGGGARVGLRATLREGLCVCMADWRTEVLQRFMGDLTFLPRVVFDTGTPPQPICCYQVDDGGSLRLPRCYRGLGAAADVEDRLCCGDALAPQLEFRGQLNELQTAAFDASCAALARAPFACILTLPCGFGKTVVSLRVALALGRKTLVVVHKENLLEQWRERIGSFLPAARVGVIQRQRADFEQVDVAVAMLQTLCTRAPPPGCLESFGLVILDEAHHLAAPYFSQLFFRLPCRHLLGLTATPRRKDGCTEILHLFMGPFGFQLAARSDAEVRVYTQSWHNSFSCRHDPTPPEVQRLKTRLTADERRNARLVELCGAAVAAERNVICLSERVEHLTGLKRLFAERCPDVPCALFVGGRSKANLEERRRAEDEARVIFATFAMAAEGLDIPRLDTLLLATPAGDVTQAVGRVLRPCADKKTPVVVDLCDDGCKAFLRLALVRRGCFERSAFRLLHDEEPCFE